MDKILTFIIGHWVLVSAFLLVFLLLMIEEARAKGVTGGLNPQVATRMINRQNAVVVDIRNKDAYKSGHIAGAMNIELPDWERGLKKLQKHKDNPIIVVDAMGSKATPFAAKLKKAGFAKAVIMSGGINAWRSANLPLVKK